MNQNKGFPPLSYLSKVFATDEKQNNKCSYTEGGSYQQYVLIFLLNTPTQWPVSLGNTLTHAKASAESF